MQVVDTPPPVRGHRWLDCWPAASGSLLAAAAVALSAYAVHASQGGAQSRLQMAALFAFGHGLALAALAPSSRGLPSRLALALLLLGTLLFSGSLAAGALFGASTAAAPLGGIVLIMGWLAHAAAALARR